MKAIFNNTVIGIVFSMLALVSLPAFSDAPWRLVEAPSTFERSCQHASGDAGGQGSMAAGTEEEEEEEDEYEEPDCD
ncbi:hypothetical protein [Thioalkalivibrio sp. HK1]|uniref:hypothetical protein n=1 Tax=Thioalkalivibrio sp. HK1 TaxID=1469245 RepID=UPI0012DE5966|nr:hypothetical protein [Thioalkalivibrio sp. HK1]